MNGRHSKVRKSPRIAAIRRRSARLLLAALLTGRAAFAGDWTNTTSPVYGWNAIACSADGTRLVAASSPLQNTPGAVYTSTDSGLNWRSNNLPGYYWTSVASSADGAKLAAVGGVNVSKTSVYISTDGGTNWTNGSVAQDDWYRIGCSADGTRLIMGGSVIIGPGGHGSKGAAPMHISTNSGLNWTNLPDAPGSSGSTCHAIVSAENGNKWMASIGGSVFTSTNGGLNWASNNLSGSIYDGIAMSADGNRLAACATFGGGLFLSTNGGATWSTNVSPASGNVSLAGSADGLKLLLADSVTITGGPLYLSTNGGLTWTPANVASNFWNAVASSADGNKLAATASFTNVIVSQTAPAPSINLQSTGQNLTLSWVVPSTSMSLQQNPGLTPANWSDVPDTPTLNLTNLQYELSLPTNGDSGFFRLAAP